MVSSSLSWTFIYAYGKTKKGHLSTGKLGEWTEKWMSNFADTNDPIFWQIDLWEKCLRTKREQWKLIHAGFHSLRNKWRHWHCHYPLVVLSPTSDDKLMNLGREDKNRISRAFFKWNMLAHFKSVNFFEMFR